jgi:hypothetical protein
MSLPFEEFKTGLRCVLRNSGRGHIQSQLVQQAAKLQQSLDGDDRRAEPHRSARRGIKHPRRQHLVRPVGRPADGNFLTATSFAIQNRDEAPSSRMPRVVHLRAVLDMGRMKRDWPSAARTGSSPAATTAPAASPSSIPWSAAVNKPACATLGTTSATSCTSSAKAGSTPASTTSSPSPGKPPKPAEPAATTLARGASRCGGSGGYEQAAPQSPRPAMINLRALDWDRA